MNSGWTLDKTCSVLHVEMSDEDKKDAYDSWKGGQHPIMFATQAFGAGIDYPSVHLVLHVGMPTSLSGFAQESGRLSRDGAGGLAYVMTSSQVRRSYMAINEDDEDGEYS
jgi:ATP-dependent DNA helicase RecQ